ncbi:MAG TPA: hypothetical protein VFU27_00405 [Terriglobales bacterium]|nr:hypothetical protein [Terriglobales bacterium]
MDATLLNALIALLPAAMLLAGGVRFFFRTRNAGSLLELLGAAALVVVILTHVCEALHVFATMGWGRQDSPGHYLDLASAILALTLFPIGYLLHAFRKQHA